MQLIEGETRAGSASKGGLADLRLAEFHEVARFGFVGNVELVARIGNALQAEDFDRSRRPRAFHGLAFVVKHGADFSEDRAAKEEIAGAERAVLHEHGGDSAAAAIHAGFEHGAAGRSVRIGLQLAHIGDEQNHFEQFIEILFLFGGNFHHHRVAAPFFRHQAAIGKLALHTLGFRAGLIHFVDGHDDGHTRSLGVIDGFEGLRHHAVIGGDHEHDDVRNLRAARAHASEGFVAGRVNENHFAAMHGHLISADVLRDSSGFASGHIGFADGVEQTCFAVVHVAHYGDDRRARHKIFGSFLPWQLPERPLPRR